MVVNYHEGAEPGFSGKTAVVLTTEPSLHPQISEAVIAACLPCCMSGEAGFYAGAFHTTKLPSISKQALMFFTSFASLQNLYGRKKSVRQGS